MEERISGLLMEVISGTLGKNTQERPLAMKKEVFQEGNPLGWDSAGGRRARGS